RRRRRRHRVGESRHPAAAHGVDRARRRHTQELHQPGERAGGVLRRPRRRPSLRPADRHRRPAFRRRVRLESRRGAELGQTRDGRGTSDGARRRDRGPPPARNRAGHQRARDARHPETSALRSFRPDYGGRRPPVSRGALRGTHVMEFPFQYDHGAPLVFGGMLPHRRSFDESKAVVLPIPVDRTTSYVGGTRNGPHEILQASSHMELWDEEMQADVHGVGIFTLPEMELPFGEMEPLIDEIERVAYEIIGRDKFLVTLGGEHSITPPLVSAAARKYPGLSLLQIDAHADMRDAYMGTVHNHACAMRRSLEYAGLTQVGIRSLSTEEAEVLPKLNTKVFYDVEMRKDPKWIDAVVESLGPHVYVTIDVDGMDPAIMPATGTPEPGGLSWQEMTALLRTTAERRTVVAADIVELSPIPGVVAPNF